MLTFSIDFSNDLYKNFNLFILNRLLNRSIDLMNKVEAETGFDPGFINNGGIFIAHDEVS